jgi:hypothetical protein
VPWNGGKGETTFAILWYIRMSMSYRIIGNLIFLLSLFPYVSPFDTPFDTQPWALFAATVFVVALLVKGKLSFPRPLFLLMVTTIYAAVIYLLYLTIGETDPLGGLRSLAGYASLFLLTFSAYKTFPYVKTNLYIMAVMIWFLAGVAQLLYGPWILEPILPRLATGGYRGLTSLAPEPAYYAMECCVLLVLNEIFYKEKRYGNWLYLIIIFILVLQIVLSYSGVGLLILLLFLVGKGLSLFSVNESTRRKLLSLFIISFVIISIGLFSTHPVLRESRAGYILGALLTDPRGLLQIDRSVSTRVANVALTLYGGLIETHGLGFGLARSVQEDVPAWLASWLGIERSWGGRTMGGLLSAVYELGVIGAAMVITVWWIIARSILYNSHMRAPLLLNTLVFLLPRHIFDPIAFPLLGYLLGVHLFYAYADPCRLGRTNKSWLAEA